MNKIYVYLTNCNETIKLTRDDCDNVSIECLYKGDKIYTWLGFSDDDLADTITDYIENGYKLKSIY
jgi:3-dehydroquinate synthase class II